MGKYIDAEKLKAEIQKLRSESCISESDDYYEYAKSEIINIIDSLQQERPKVELNEETIINEFRVLRDKCFNEGIEGWQREKLIARHFYELGRERGRIETKEGNK